MLSETEYVEVSPAPVAPIAAFFGTPTSGRAPLTVSFTDTSTDDPTGWAWFFGDETYSEPWIEINASSGWTARNGHRAVTMPDGSIILMGGYDGTALRNDTWRSTDRGRTWTLMNASSGWTGRVQPGIVVLPDSSILLIGGDDPAYRNDVWRSADYGATWTLTSASSPWWGRWGHTTVAMPDGSIVLMGGFPGMIMNDTWRSADYGATWTLVNASSGWTARWAHTAVAMPDGSILLMGGYDRSRRNDVWRSDDYGATWTLVNASSGWMGRYGHTTVTMPDDSILVMGGIGMNDTWRSTDYGVTWTEVNVSSGWTERYYYSSVAMPDGSVLLMGGVSDDGTRLNDTWQLQPAGSSEQNPSHTYTTPGIYPVTLQAFNTGGHNSTRTTGYITVTPIAAFGSTPTSGPAPLTIAFTDISTGSPVAWNWLFGDGKTSTEQHPVHTYTLPGNYTVTLGVDGGLSTVTEPGYIKVTPVLFGDANEDGEVNQADTLVVLQEIVELREIPVAGTDRFRKTDVTGNGAIDVGDALFIAQYNVGLRDPWFVLL
ncbi:PKD domain-containing protein [Methanoculleus sp. Wushi-C6]|uniref:PKD domain-containing protein n=2 Tax=Methanoculleus caldifontis TaxID=2651577 RepID=A0ABU3WY39_9EURY|nr:PKD domain-containing protein [Methanoculleus sp. Wushi-C6]